MTGVARVLAHVVFATAATLWIASICQTEVAVAGEPVGDAGERRASEVSPAPPAGSAVDLQKEAEGPPDRQQMRHWLRQLDADDYATREQASQHLSRLMSGPMGWQLAGDVLWEAWLSPAISYETRCRLRPLVERLGLASSGGGSRTEAAPPERDAVAGLVGQLLSDSFAARAGAAARIRWLVEQRDDWIVPVMIELQRRLDSPTLSASARHWLEPLWEKSRGQWLVRNPPARLPDVSQSDIRRWIAELVPKPGAGDRALAYKLSARAERHLTDCLARDDLLPTTARLLREALEEPEIDPETAERVEALLSWTHPAMVAEYWQASENHANGQPWARHLGIQHLLIGVPSIPAGAERASHFDAINDREAHCVSGNSLSPGNWPVGVAFPHPSQDHAFFHLVNLPTPRRRMAYEYEVTIDESRRLKQITRNTLQRLLDEKRRMNGRELRMLAMLDMDVVSEFVPRYVQQVADAPQQDDSSVPREAGSWPAGPLSHHAALCHLLARYGTSAAIPQLLVAIEHRCFLPPTDEAPYELPWIAVLAIARRDPWPEVDEWLAQRIEQKQPLRMVGASRPELGASAAAILIERHGTPATDFGIAPVLDRFLQQVGCPSYRFVDDEKRERVALWWSSQDHTAVRAAARQVDVP